MKKRLLALLLAVTMVASLIVLPAEAATSEVGPTASATCPHCGKSWDSIDWKELGYSAEAALEGTGVLTGHYYLADDQSVRSAYTFGVGEDQTEDQAVDVCIDLRGFTLESSTDNARTLYVYDYSKLAILDTVGGGQIIGTGHSGSNRTGGVVYMAENTQVDLYSGKLVNTSADHERYGGVVYVGSGAQFNMHGGEIDASKVAPASGVSTYGGAVYTYAGEINVSGGLIRGGSATYGGSVYVGGTGEATISGGTIMGGHTPSRGGNIYNSSKLTISGGTITGGTTNPTGDVRGGNIFSTGSNAELTISGGLIEEGQTSGNSAGSYGGNVTFTAGKTTISGGTIRGGVSAWSTATITGNPVIDNQGYEGIVVHNSNSYTFKLTIKDLDEDARVIIRNARESDTYFSPVADEATSPDLATYLENGQLLPASRYNLTMEDGAIGSKLDNTGYCPHCGKEVSWGKLAATTTASGHYFVGGTGLTLAQTDAVLSIASGKDVVIDLNRGLTIPAPFAVAGKLSILCTTGSIAQLKCSKTGVTNGGVATVSGTMNVYDGVIVGSTVSGKGGAIYVNNGKLNLYGGMIQDGTATDGGNIYLTGSSSQLNMQGGYVVDGTATGSSGNLQVEGGALVMNGGVIADGYASSNGGNLQTYTGGEVTINGGFILGGEAKNRGGNISSPATNGVTTINGGLVANGTANYGGNIYMGHGKLNVYGGTIANGLGKQYGGNVALYGVYNSAHNASCCSVIGDNDTADTNAAPVLTGGDSPLGANLYIDGVATVGKATVTGGDAETAPLYIGNSAILTLTSGFDCELNVQVGEGRINELDQHRVLLNTTCDGLKAKLFVTNYEMAQLVENEANQLALSGAALVSEATGELTWYLDAQSAYNDYADGVYLKLYTPQSITLSGDTILDLNGNEATVTGSGALYGFDSANEDYDGNGSATISGDVTVEPAYRRPDGKQYVTLTEDGVTTFHRLGISISNVSVRPSIAGVYYQGVWQCDSALQAKIKTFGVALSVVDMPDTNFATDDDTLYTQFGPNDYVSGAAKTSVLVANILKEGIDTNAQRGATDIYAAPYMVLDDGTDKGLTIVADDRKPNISGVSYSLQDVMGTVNRIWPKLNDIQRTGVRAFYNIDTAVMDAWNLYNIKADITGTPAVRPLKVLTLGHSLAVDTGHMVNLVADAEGYSEEFIIGTLYYSGCNLFQHVNFIKGNSPEYALYISSSLNPDAPPERLADYTMYEALKYTDWDIIIMQGGVYEPTKAATYTDGNIQFIQNYVNEHKTNPDAIFAWNNLWSPPTDPDLMAMYGHTPHVYEQWYEVFNSDRMAWFNAALDKVATYIETDGTFIYSIPTGTAVMNASTSYLTQKELHRDYVHASDLSRVMAAYTYYCTLTGIDHLDEIKLDTIPVAFFKSTTGTEDRVLTQAEKDIILESVNNALANPGQVTQSQYTVRPE